MRIFQKGFNFSQDGPGNRLVYHLQGCNMRCIWCSNPEGMSHSGGVEVPSDDIVRECISARPMFFSGGGVTFTGGEATVWGDELIGVLSKLKEHNIHTAIETNGTCERLGEFLDFVDYLIMDFKHYDDELHRKYTGISNLVVKRNYEQNCSNAVRQHIRIPLINGINTGNPEEFAKYFSSFDTQNTVFEFLPYHEFGKEKWKTDYLVKDGFISGKTLEQFKETFKNHGLIITET